MEDVTAGKHAGDVGLQALVHHRAIGHRRKFHPCPPAQLILRDQPAGEQQSVTVVVLLGAGDGAAVFIHLGQRHAGEALPALDIHHRVAELQWDAEVVQALDDVALKPPGVGHQLRHHLDMGALQGHPPGHNEADVTAAQNHHFFSRHKAFDIHQPLGGAGGIDPRRTKTGDIEGPPGPLPAAHGQYHRPGLELKESLPGIYRRDHPLRRDLQHHGVQKAGNCQVPDLLDIPLGVLRAGKLLLEGVEAKTTVDTLVEDTAQFCVPLQDQDILYAALPGGHSRRQSRGAAADDDQITPFHTQPPLQNLPCPFPGSSGNRRRTW